ncbi:MAG: TerC family protein, partial [Bacteroidia bacterium]
ALLDPSNLFSLLMLTFMEIVLGIDNIIFVSIVAAKLPQANQVQARNIGMVMALLIRVALLFGIKWIVGLKADVFSLAFLNEWVNYAVIHDPGISIKDLILIAGGLFLVGKSVSEMYEKLQGHDDEHGRKKIIHASFSSVVFEITLLNIVFSFDSILTAIGLVDPNQIPIMVASIVLSMIAMMIFSGPVSNYINKRPTVKILALSFLVLIGFMLISEGLGQEVNKGYVYFAIVYAFGVELINQRLRKKVEPLHLHETYTMDEIEKEIADDIARENKENAK